MFGLLFRFCLLFFRKTVIQELKIIFAVIHPLWTAPIIFFLSLALGYVYERTGNLWAVILLHAIFNTVSTTLYLLYATN